MKKILLSIALIFMISAADAQKPCITSTRVDEGTPSNGCTGLIGGKPVLGKITLNLASVATVVPTIFSITANNGSKAPGNVKFGQGTLTHGGTKVSFCYYDAPNNEDLSHGANKYSVVIKYNGEDCAVSTTCTAPIAPVLSANIAVCESGSIILSATQVAGGITCWYDKNGIEVKRGPEFTTPVLNESATYTAINKVGDCISEQAEITAVVNPLPTVISPDNYAICSGFSTSLSGAGAVSYSWTSGITDGISFTPASTMTYTVTGTDANSCTNTSSTTVTVDMPATADAGNDQSFNGISVQLAGIVGGTGATSTWSTNGTGTFNSNTLPNAVYTPSIADVLLGSVILTLTNTPIGSACPAAATDQMIIRICLGFGGGNTHGFWGNKNGEAALNSCGAGTASANMTNAMNFLVALNLRSATGTHFDPSNYASFKAWNGSANATNMAYMLSCQMVSTQLSVRCVGNNGGVNGTRLIFAPGTLSANVSGFATVNAVMNEANVLLGQNGLILSGNSDRARATALKNALDEANNNRNFLIDCGVATSRNGSTEIALEKGMISVNELKVSSFPNPFTSQFKLNIKSPVSGMANIQFYSVNGAMLSEMRHFVQADINNIVDVKADQFKSNVIYRISVGEFKTNGMVLSK